MGADVGTLIDRLGETAKDCRQLIREMHEAEQSLKATIRDARDARAFLQAILDEDLVDQLDKRIAEHMDKVGEAAHAGYRRVLEQFDVLAEPLYQTLRMAEPLAELQARKAERRDAEEDCPRCGAPSAWVTEINGRAIAPGRGDRSVCGECGALSIYTGIGRSRRAATEEERFDFMVEPTYAKAWQGLARIKGFPEGTTC